MKSKSNVQSKSTIVLALIAINLICYLQIQESFFIFFDDDKYVVENIYVKNGFNIESVLWSFSTFHQSNWHPLTWLSLMLDASLFGVSPKYFHLTNLFFHIANTVFLFVVLHKITYTLWRSAFVAVLFAVHPLHVESVAWVAERKDVLSTLLWILTILAYTKYVKQPGLRKYSSVFFLMAAGLMAKPMLVTLPFVLLLLDWWPLGRMQTNNPVYIDTPTSLGSFKHHLFLNCFLEKIPLFVLSSVSCIITFMAQQKGKSVISLNSLPFDIRIKNAILAYGTYIQKAAWPAKLSIFYPYSININLHIIILMSILLILISVAAFYFYRKFPYLFTGWLLYVSTLVPVIGLVQVGEQAIADRYTYIPLIGIFMIFTWGSYDLVRHYKYSKIILSTLSGIILAILVFLTWKQVGYWQDTKTLFEHALNVTTNNYLAHNNLGLFLKKEKKFDQAIEHFREALRINPSYINVVKNLALTLGLSGKPDEGIKYLQSVMTVMPEDSKLHHSLGVLMVMKGENADKYFQEALRLDPSIESEIAIVKKMIKKPN